MFSDASAIELFTVAGVLLANYWLYRLDGKFFHLRGRVDEQGNALTAHVNAPLLRGLRHATAASDEPPTEQL